MNTISQMRAPEKQRNYEDWEKRLILLCDGKGITADKLSTLLNRSEGSIVYMAHQVGSSLKSKKK